MNKKKTTAVLAAVMAVQILVCCFMVGYGKTTYNAILKKGTEYKFAVSEFSINPDEEDGFLHISFPDDKAKSYYLYYNSDSPLYPVIEVGEDSLAWIVEKQNKEGEILSPSYASNGCYTDDFELKVDSETAEELTIFSNFINEFCGSKYFSGSDSAWFSFNKTEYQRWFSKLENEKLIELAQKQIDSKNISNIVDSYVTAVVYKGRVIYKAFYLGDMLIATINN